VYFPAGVFVVTSTLLLNRTTGAGVFGHGADTTLRWGGGASNGSRLWWSDGNTRFTIEGFVWDGAGACEVCGVACTRA